MGLHACRMAPASASSGAKDDDSRTAASTASAEAKLEEGLQPCPVELWYLVPKRTQSSAVPDAFFFLLDAAWVGPRRSALQSATQK